VCELPGRVLQILMSEIRIYEWSSNNYWGR
jgi:hypothetical protein